MARINEKHLGSKEQKRHNIHSIVDATYFFFDRGDERFFQLDTYGSPDREVRGMPSQKVQFDKKNSGIHN
jgi:hypothetical protein